MNTAEQFDIVVIGAGPAGAMAAAHAARGGRRVALLERKEKPGLPVRCGEGAGVKGLRRSVEIDPSWIRARINRIKMVSPSGIEVNLTSKDQGLILDRGRMEEDLVRRAVNLGARLHVQTPVSTIEYTEGLYRSRTPDGREFRSPCVIIADGVESRLARFLGWKTALPLADVSTCAFAHVATDSVEQDKCVFYFGRNVSPGGYVWVFPRGEGSANVGLGILGSESTPGRPQELLERFIAEKFPGAAVSNLHCGGDPLAHWLKPLVRNGAMVVGDAARQVNAISGAGISYAMLAGRMAGESAARAFAGESLNTGILHQYERAWAADCGRQQARSYALKDVIVGFDDAFLDTIARHFASRDPRRITHVNVFMKALQRYPRLMLKAFLLFR